jgi:hypothetical protein
MCVIQHWGRAMAQAVSRRPLTAEVRVRSRGQSMWDLWWTEWHSDRVFPEYFGFAPSVSFHRFSITRKNEKTNSFITGLYNKPQDCGASVGSAAWPFTTKKNTAQWRCVSVELEGTSHNRKSDNPDFGVHLKQYIRNACFSGLCWIDTKVRVILCCPHTLSGVLIMNCKSTRVMKSFTEGGECCAVWLSTGGVLVCLVNPQEHVYKQTFHMALDTNIGEIWSHEKCVTSIPVNSPDNKILVPIFTFKSGIRP